MRHQLSLPRPKKKKEMEMTSGLVECYLEVTDRVNQIAKASKLHEPSRQIRHLSTLASERKRESSKKITVKEKKTKKVPRKAKKVPRKAKKAKKVAETFIPYRRVYRTRQRARAEKSANASRGDFLSSNPPPPASAATLAPAPRLPVLSVPTSSPTLESSTVPLPPLLDLNVWEIDTLDSTESTVSSPITIMSPIREENDDVDLNTLWGGGKGEEETDSDASSSSSSPLHLSSNQTVSDDLVVVMEDFHEAMRKCSNWSRVWEWSDEEVGEDREEGDGQAMGGDPGPGSSHPLPLDDADSFFK